MQQNRTILAVDDDNFTDIAIRYTQNAENAFLLAELNGMNVDDIIASGTEILIPAKSEAPVIFVQKKVTEIEPTTSALLELQKKHSATVATAQQLGHVRSGSQIRVKEDGTMEVIGGSGGALIRLSDYISAERKSYLAFAPQGSQETDAVWTITKRVGSADGTIISNTQTEDWAWTNRTAL